jgi:hypothetical protein
MVLVVLNMYIYSRRVYTQDLRLNRIHLSVRRC